MQRYFYPDLLSVLRKIRECLLSDVPPGELASWTESMNELLGSATHAVEQARKSSSTIDDHAALVAIDRLLRKTQAEIDQLCKSWTDDFQQAETQIQLGRAQQVGVTAVGESIALLEQSDETFAD